MPSAIVGVADADLFVPPGDGICEVRIVERI
jgi:hypothetical protein